MHISPSPSTSVSPHLLHASSSFIVTLPHLPQSRSPPHSQASVQHHRQVSASLQKIAFDWRATCCTSRGARGGEERRGQERRGDMQRERREQQERHSRQERARGEDSESEERSSTHSSMLSFLIHLTRRFTPPVSLSSVIHDTHPLSLLSLLLLRESYFRHMRPCLLLLSLPPLRLLRLPPPRPLPPSRLSNRCRPPPLLPPAPPLPSPHFPLRQRLPLPTLDGGAAAAARGVVAELQEG